MSPVVKIIQPSGILDGTKASQFRQEISDLGDKLLYRAKVSPI